MGTIPKEYLDSSFDFGFSTTEDAPVQQQPVQVVTPTEAYEPVIARINAMEELLSDMKSTMDRLENASTPLDTDEYKTLIEKDVKKKLADVEKLIIPLLVNLMKNPEKDTIKWPNRTPVIQAQIDKIIAITRS